MHHSQYAASDAASEWAELTENEIENAIKFGVEMRNYSQRNNHKNNPGYRPDETKAKRVQSLGALAEAIAAKALGRPIALRSETYNVADLPGGIQVRLLGKEHYGLRVYPKDDIGWRILGVCIPEGSERSGKYRLPGWCWATEAFKHEEWSMAPNGRPPMYCVPQHFLMPVTSLRRLIDHEETMNSLTRWERCDAGVGCLP